MNPNNYQFTHTIEEQSQSYINFLLLLLKDLFPYFKLKSVTITLQTLSIIPFFFQLLKSTLIPPGQYSFPNTFELIFNFLVKSTLYVRLGSEYEHRLGLNYFLACNIVIVVCQFMCHLGMRILSWETLFNGGGSLALFILSVVNFELIKQNEIVEFETQEKVQNYDLLDLNDTIVKLKSKESVFSYESYTNKQFYFHNLSSSSPKTNSKPRKKKIINKSSNLSHLIDDPSNSSSQEQLEVKIYKIIIFHFGLFAHLPIYELATVVFIESVLYLTLVSRVLKKMFD